MQPSPRPPQIPQISPFDLLWGYRHREPTAFNLLRAARAAHIWRNAGHRLKARVALRYLHWVWKLPAKIVACQIRYGKLTSHTFKRSRFQQVQDLVRLAVRNHLLPLDYYKGGLARYQGASGMFDYVPEHLYETMLVFLRDAGGGRGQTDSKKKLHFEERCKALNLPCVHTVAVAETDGSFSGLAGGQLPLRSLFLKPAQGSQGKGTERWHYQDAGFVRLGGNQRLSAQGLLQRASESARQSGIPTLIQEALTNHPDVHRIAGETTATSRIMTLNDESGRPEVVFAAMRVAGRSDCPADNFHSGGILFPVSIASGRMSEGVRLDFCENPRFWTDNPLTGAKVDGTVQPFYRDIWDLALRAHAAMPERILMGWDIATTPAGPVIVEGGGKPGMSMAFQFALGGFLESRLSVLMAKHVLKRLAEREPAQSRWLCQGQSSAVKA